MSIALNVTASFYDHKGIPPRCRKPQPTYFTVRTALEVVEVPAGSFSLAATIKGRNSSPDQYFTSDALEGFYAPVADLSDVQRLDLEAGGIFGDTQGTLDLSPDATEELASALFGLNLSYVRETKIADKHLAHQFQDEWRDKIFTLPWGCLKDSEGREEPTEDRALAYLTERAGQLVASGSAIFRRVPEPRLLVQVTDNDSKYLAAWNRPDYLRPPRETQEIWPTLSICTGGNLTNSEPTQVFDYQLRPLTDIQAIVGQFTEEMQALESAGEHETLIRKLPGIVADLGVTIYKPEAFTPAPAFPSRLVRISRLRAGAIVDCLHASYGGVAHYMSRHDQKPPIPADVQADLLAELQELTALVEGESEPLFLPAERAVYLR